MRRILIIFLLFLIGTLESKAGLLDGKGTTVFPFLKINPSVQSAALAGSDAPTLTGVQAVFLNPAGISSIESPEIYAQYTKWIDDMNLMHFATVVYVESLAGALGFSMSYADYAQQKETVQDSTSLYDYSVVSKFSPYTASAGLYYASYLGNMVDGGIGARFIYQSIGDFKELNALAFDLGIRYEYSEELSYGLSLNNISQGAKYSSDYEALPMLLRLGAQWKSPEPRFRTFNNFSYSPFANWSYLFNFSSEFRFKEGVYLKAGLEVLPIDLISMKIGYSYALESDDLGGIGAADFGFSLIGFMNMDIDYAISSLGRLGIVHRAGIKFKL